MARRHQKKDGEIQDQHGWAIEPGQAVQIRRTNRKPEEGEVLAAYVDEKDREVVDVRRYVDQGVCTVLADDIFTRTKPTVGKAQTADIMERLGERMKPRKRGISRKKPGGKK